MSLIPGSNTTAPADTGPNIATCVLLVLVSGRQAEFPAVIGHATESGDRDSLFISTICLASFGFVALLLIVALAIWLCCLQRKGKKLGVTGQDQDGCETLNGRRKPKDGGTVMRSVHSDSERRFIRELSLTEVTRGTDNPAYRDIDGHRLPERKQGTMVTDDDQFGTDIESYYSLQGILHSPCRPSLTAAPELIAFQDACSLTNNDSFPVNEPEQKADLRIIPHQDGHPRNLQTQCRAMDLLTSVAPFKDGHSSPLSSFLSNGQAQEVTPASSSAGTCRSVRSMRDVDVNGELEDLMTGRPPSTLGPPQTVSSLSPHLHGLLPEQPHSTLEEAVTPFLRSVCDDTGAPGPSLGLSSSHTTRSSSGGEPPLPGVSDTSAIEASTSTAENWLVSSIHLVPDFSLTNFETYLTPSHQSDLKADQRTLGGRLTGLSTGGDDQPNGKLSSSSDNGNLNVFTVSL